MVSATAGEAAPIADGVQANGRSVVLTLSGDGRFLAFASTASNLVAGDTNGTFDVFRRELPARRTRLVTVGLNGAPANGPSLPGAISKRSRFIAFESSVSNLVPGDTNGDLAGVFVADVRTAAIRRITFPNPVIDAAYERTDPALSADGRFVAFSSDADNLVPGDENPGRDIFVRDMQTGQIRRLSVATDGTSANEESTLPDISANGRRVVFSSDASNLVPDDTNGLTDVFAHFLRSRRTVRASVGSAPR